jgi:ABC-type glycerol-3-phosphate transport system substrate-binding protein
MFPSVLEAFGGSIVRDFPNDMHPTLDEPVAIEAAEYYAEAIQNYGFPGGLTAHWLELVTAYQQGQIAMLPEAYLLSGQILDPEKSVVVDQTGFAIIPRGDDARVAAAAVHGLGIPHNAPNPELGYKYIEWILSEEMQLRNCLEHHTSSCTRGAVMSNPEYVETFGYNDGQFVEVLSETLANYADPFYRPMTPEWRQVEEEIGIAMSNVLTGQESAAEALKKANDALNEIYLEAGYYTE